MFFSLIKKTNRSLSNAFNSINEINRLRKEMNRLLSKGISNIYLKVTIETFSKLRFFGFKNLSPAQFLSTPTRVDIIKF